ncbi:MAG: hypothetical protein IPL27_19010 [Lewinellaceae bacterium]|nr:hypothetical protein [Lewinellaceae bacterium]
MSWLITVAFMLFFNHANAQATLSFPVNILEGIQNGQITVTHSALDIGIIEHAFDGDLNSLARSAAVNPMTVTLQSTFLFHITATRFTNNSELSKWTVESALTLVDLNSKTGSYHKLVDAASHTGFATSERSVLADAKFLRLTIQKECCDDFVHLQEWGITATSNVQVTSICMKPSQVRLIPNAHFQPNWFATDADGNEFLISSDISWTSSNEGVVSVNASGVFASTETSVKPPFQRPGTA